MDITERFLNYTKFDTQSAEDSDSVPSTPKQLVFAEYLKKELKSEGLSNVDLDSKGYLYATLKANTKDDVPTIGFISHYDTKWHQMWFGKQKIYADYPHHQLYPDVNK